ncbi:MAG: NAD(+)/NADH kinase [Firmicutes bacterium]|nr:NAD(+)/NADH kinase [Bacillota bacterium]
MSKIAIVYNGRSEEANAFCQKLANYLNAQGAELFHPDQKYGFTLDDIKKYDFSGVDAAVVLGGDGTVLASGRIMSKYNVPLLGVNMGKVGFLTEVEVSDAFRACDRMLAQDYQLEQRMLLQSSLWRQGKVLASATAFNDLVVKNSHYARSVILNLLIDGKLVNAYQADGLIVSTPTGSTGYSFSAGGPIVACQMDLMMITPVCPHSFFSRPIIVSAQSDVEIVCRSKSDHISLTIDGQFASNLRLDDTLKVATAKDKVRMIRFGEICFYDRIKSKLNYDFHLDMDAPLPPTLRKNQ